MSGHRENRIRESERDALVKASRSPPDHAGISAKTQIGERPLVRLYNRNTVEEGKESVPPQQIFRIARVTG